MIKIDIFSYRDQYRVSAHNLKEIDLQEMDKYFLKDLLRMKKKQAKEIRKKIILNKFQLKLNT